MKDFKKLKISLEGQLIGLKFDRALHAMALAQRFHTGSRKDGSPEFQHQVEQALYALTLPVVNIAKDQPFDLEELIVVIFLHDVMEDYGVTMEDIELGYSRGVDFAFGKATARRVYLMSKVYRGIKKDSKEVFEEMWKDIYVALAKGIDRTHNHGTMTAAFKLSKILGYMQETKEYILPMLKKGRKSNPRNAAAFYNIETILHRDIHMLQCLIDRFINQEDTTAIDPTFSPSTI